MGEQTEIEALRTMLRERTKALEAIAQGPDTVEELRALNGDRSPDYETFGRRAQRLAKKVLGQQESV